MCRILWNTFRVLVTSDVNLSAPWSFISQEHLKVSNQLLRPSRQGLMTKPSIQINPEQFSIYLALSHTSSGAASWWGVVGGRIGNWEVGRGSQGL